MPAFFDWHCLAFIQGWEQEGPTIIASVLATAALVVLIAFFSISEIALFALNRLKLDYLARQGHSGAIVVGRILQKPDDFLTTILIWNTIAHTVAPIIFATVCIAAWGPAAGAAIASIIMTFAILFVGEIVPKVLASQYPEQLSWAVARSLRVFMATCKPLVWLSTLLTDAFFALFGVKVRSRLPTITRDELRHYVKLSREAGALPPEEHQLLASVFEFRETIVKDIMIPRDKMFAVDMRAPQDKLIAAIAEQGFTRVPVYDGSPEKIVGILHSKDVMNMILYRNVFIMEDLIREPFFVFEDERIHEIFRRMRSQRTHMAIVKSRRDQIVGALTLEDVIEELVGEIADEHDVDTQVRQ
jgi:putative hemolysin